MKKFIRFAAALVLCMAAPMAQADWHMGKIMYVSIGYDGSTISFRLQGVPRSGCTCYPTWDTNMCLNRSRVSFKDELALLYSVKARDREIAVNIDESSCSVIAMYEPD